MSHELYHKACRVFLFPAVCLFVAAAYAAGQANQQAAGKNDQSTTAPTATAPSSEAPKYVARQRGIGAMRGLPQPTWHRNRAAATEPAGR
jgi:hypothetical protein